MPFYPYSIPSPRCARRNPSIVLDRKAGSRMSGRWAQPPTLPGTLASCSCCCSNTWISTKLWNGAAALSKARGVYRDAVRSSRQQLVGQRPALDFPDVAGPCHAIGPCPFLPCWRPRNATTGSADAGLEQCAAGCPTAPWYFGTAANRWLDVTLIARLRLDAGSQPGQNGRPPLNPTAARAEDTPGLPTVSWATVSAAWYDGTVPHATHLANGGLVPLGQAAGTPALGLGSPPGLALHRSVGGPDADPGMVCAALATGGHLSGGTGSGRGDPTPVVGSGHWYYANPDGTPPWRPIFCGNNDRPIAPRLASSPTWSHRSGAPAVG